MSHYKSFCSIDKVPNVQSPVLVIHGMYHHYVFCLYFVLFAIIAVLIIISLLFFLLHHFVIINFLLEHGINIYSFFIQGRKMRWSTFLMD